MGTKEGLHREMRWKRRAKWMIGLAIFLVVAQVVFVVYVQHAEQNRGAPPPVNWKRPGSNLSSMLLDRKKDLHYPPAVMLAESPMAANYDQDDAYNWYCTRPDNQACNGQTHIARHTYTSSETNALGGVGGSGAGAATGAAIGTALGPEGTIPGAVVGAMAGAISGAGVTYYYFSQE